MNARRSYRALLFDVMGTLVHAPFFEEMPEFFGMAFQDLLRTLRPGPWVEFELGRRTEPTEEFSIARPAQELWRSADGRTWERAGVNPLSFGWCSLRLTGGEILVNENPELLKALTEFGNAKTDYETEKQKRCESGLLPCSQPQ